MTKTLNTPPGGYLLFKNDVWANPDRLAITTQSRKFARFETRGFGGRSLAAILEWRKSSAFQVGAWRQMPDADAAVPAATILHAEFVRVQELPPIRPCAVSLNRN